MIVIGKDHVDFRVKGQNKLLRLHLTLHCEASKPTPGLSVCQSSTSFFLPIQLEIHNESWGL